MLFDVAFLLYKIFISAVKTDTKLPYQYLNTELTICYAAWCVTLAISNPDVSFWWGVGGAANTRPEACASALRFWLRTRSSMFISKSSLCCEHAPWHTMSSQGAIFMATCELPWNCHEHMAYTKELHIIVCTAKSAYHPILR